MTTNDENAISVKRAVAYVRVSDDSQIDGYSMDAQQSEIERWCERRGYCLVKIYKEAGVTAHSDRIEERPELVRLLNEADRQDFDIVLVHSLCRWARRLRIQIQALDRLAKAKVDFASVTESFDSTTKQGRLMLNQMGSFNEYFSEQLGEHVKKAFRLIVESGLPVGDIPFGYSRQTEKKLPPLKVDREADALIEVFQRRVEGQSYGEIATWLNKQNFRTRKGHAFTAHAIRDILENRFYCGYIKHNKKEFPAKHDPIIPKELFQRVQSRKQTRPLVRSVHGPKGLLQGIAICSHCGNGLQSDRKHQTTPIYRERHAHECPTNETSVVAEVIDKQVATLVHSLEIKPDWKQQMAQFAVTIYDGPRPEELREKRRRIVRGYVDEGYSEHEYQSRLAEIDRLIAQTTIVTPPDIEKAVELFSNLPALWNEATTEERRALMKSLVELVYVDIKEKRVMAVKPTPAFRALYNAGINAGPDTPGYIDVLR